jgi:RND family efflux transporter MFP subunit
MFVKKVAALAALVAAAACSRGQQAGPAGGQGMPPATVEVAVAQQKPIEDASEYVATLKSLHSTAIQPQIDGQITQIYVKSGDRVKKGAPLVQIDPRRQQAAVSSQQAELEARQAAVEFARQQQQRAQQLLTAGAISKQEAEQADTALKTAQADLASLQAQVRQQQVQLRYYTVDAPTAGIVGDVPARVGNQVTSSTVLTTIDQNETLEVYVSVPIERAPELKIGLPLQVLSGNGSSTLAETTISFISPSVDQSTQTVLVKGQVKNPESELRASQFVRARIVWKTAPGLVIPVTAVLRLNGQYFAFIAESAGGKTVAKQRPITVGPIVGNDYTVTSGIKPGEKVVVSDVQRLTDGAPIQAKG